MLWSISPGLKAKTKKIRDEFLNLNLVEPRLVGAVMAAGVWVKHRGYPDIVLTSVVRRSGRDDSPHKIMPERPRSLAVDFRCHHGYYTKEQLKELLEFFRIYFPRYDMLTLESQIPGWWGTARVHGEGDHEHVHVAIPSLQRALTAIDFTPPVDPGE